MFKNTLILAFILLGIACSKNVKVIDDLNDRTFELVNQNNETITFPDEYEGKFVIMGFIYTHCPDVCPLITQNMVKIQKQLGAPEDVQFLGVTFDPKRDTPEVLKEYKNAFDLGDNFDFLTADTTTMNTFLDSVRVRTQVSLTTTNGKGEEVYFLSHSDKIMVIDPKGRVVLEYGGSMTPIDYIIDDYKSIR